MQASGGRGARLRRGQQRGEEVDRAAHERFAGFDHGTEEGLDHARGKRAGRGGVYVI
jgi:hypothetical protein